jgi:hypothetical protein
MVHTSFRLIRVYRITTFVPARSVRRVLASVLRIVPLEYGGQYDSVAWWSAPGIEHYRSLDGSHPRVGRPGRVSTVQSIALTFSIPRKRRLLTRVIHDGIMSVHPWDEPVITVTEALETQKHRSS